MTNQLPSYSFLASNSSPIPRAVHTAILLLAAIGLLLPPHQVRAQSLSFAGAETTLLTLPAPATFNGVNGVAADSAGDVFVIQHNYEASSYSGSSRVLEFPKTSTGYGPQTILPFSGLSYSFGIALDSAGDVFIADNLNSRVVELPRTATGYGLQTTLPASGLFHDFGIALDSGSLSRLMAQAIRCRRRATLV